MYHTVHTIFIHAEKPFVAKDLFASGGKILLFINTIVVYS